MNIVSNTTDDIIPIGTIMMYAVRAPPFGYLFCDGSSISRTVYNRLFSIIGTTFGSADANSFNLPDMRDRFPMGAGNQYILAAQGGVFSTQGSITRDNTIIIGANNLPNHYHNGTTDGSSPGNGSTTIDYVHTGGLIPDVTVSTPGGSHSHTFKTSGNTTTNSDYGISSVQNIYMSVQNKYLSVFYIIKY